MSGGEIEVINAIPWAQFGLAGLFGVFALVLTSYFLKALDKVLERASEERKEFVLAINKLADKLDKLDQSIQQINSGG